MAIKLPQASIIRNDLLGFIPEIDVTGADRGFVGSQIFPTFDVSAWRQEVQRIPRAEWLRSQRSLRRGRGGDGNKVDTNLERDTIDLVEYTAHGVVDQIQEQNALASLLDTEQLIANFCTNMILQQIEEDDIAEVVSETNFPVANTGKDVQATPWTGNTGTPLTDVNDVRDKIWLLGGIEPNLIAMNKKNFRTLGLQSQVTSAFTGGTPDRKAAVMDPALLGTILNIDRVVISGGVKNTAAKGQTMSGSPIFSDTYAFLGYVSGGDPRVTPSFGSRLHGGQFIHDGNPVGASTKNGVYIYVDEFYEGGDSKKRAIRATAVVSRKIWHAQLGGLIKNVRG